MYESHLMDIKTYALIFFGCAIINTLPAEFYVKAGTGLTVPLKAIIHAPAAEWDPSPQGYDSHLGSKFMLSAGLGYDFPWMFSMDVTGTYRFNYHYNHFQTAVDEGTPGFLGNKTRTFDLDIGTFMVNAYFSGRGVPCMNWNFGIFSINIYPFLGFGVGGNQLTISNFRSISLPSVRGLCSTNTPSLDPSFGSENQYTERFNFAYQLFIGLEAKFCDAWALSCGYRWFDAGRFKGPRYLRDQCGFAQDIGNNEWRINVSANEFFIELKAYL
jgi:opacity protein-like surface antigen